MSTKQAALLEICIICLEDIIVGQKSDAAHQACVVRPCGHLFHKVCCNNWNNRSCPNCRQNISRTFEIPDDVPLVPRDFIATKASGKSKKKTAQSDELPSPADLMLATNKCLREHIEIGNLGVGESERLDQEITLAGEDRKRLEFIVLNTKLAKKLPLIYSKDVREYEGTRELKFLAFKVSETRS